MTPHSQFCTFHLAGHEFGIAIASVQEVVRRQEVTPVPLAPAEVRGLINLRGRIVASIDLRRRLGLPERPAELVPTHLLVSTDDGPVSLEVDRIEDVLEVAATTIEAPPENLPEALRRCLTGVGRLEGRLLLLLDHDEVLHPQSRAAVAG